MSASYANSNIYFAATNHIKSPSWLGYSENQRTAAIASARRILSRLSRCENIEAAMEADDYGRNPEYAVYEQALFMLQNTPYSNVDGSFSVADATDADTETNARAIEQGIISPEAMRWLVPGGMIQLSRG